MKKYNIPNYIRYKNDVLASQPDEKELEAYNEKELTCKFLPLVENIARKFSTTQQASGVMSINDLIQDGNLSLLKAIRRIDWEKLNKSDDQEKTMKSFLSKRIKGGIRRAIDINRGDMRIPEHKLNEIRKNNGKDQKMVAMFFNSMFLSIDDKPKDDEENMIYQIADKSEPYNIGLLNTYLTGLLRKHLNEKEYNVLRLSYGLDCEKHSANKIAELLNIDGSSAYVRVSELKKQAVDKLIDSVDHSQVLDYL
ncbi:MAG: sigma-70 family RNA polymerase sigma factor [Pelagibacterales bacterium]|jgi:RNA polymerase sigma factor (sigma-70 family)|nr:sigma-70 family RNA polymerase sigma factor [Pelagibacterales bacterium]